MLYLLYLLYLLSDQVRIVAGTLVRIGLRHHASCGGEPEGASSPVSHDVARILEAQDRVHAGPTAPAAGLCLEHVEYECEWAASHWDK